MKNSKGITISSNLYNHLAVTKRVFVPTKECLLPNRTIPSVPNSRHCCYILILLGSNCYNHFLARGL